MKKKLSILLTERHYYTLKATMNMKTLKISIANGNCAVKIILVITSGITFVIACVQKLLLRVIVVVDKLLRLLFIFLMTTIGFSIYHISYGLEVFWAIIM